MTDPNIFNYILVWPIINALIAVYKFLQMLGAHYTLGFSIIVLTILIRLILYPLTSSQLKASKKMQELAPHLSKLKDKHKNDAKTLQAETMKLYKEFGVNPAAGCLPLIVQLPIIWGLYSVLQQIVSLGAKDVAGNINKIVYFDFLKLSGSWDPNFFGIPLGQNPAGLISKIGPLILIVPLLTFLFQFVQSKMMIPQNKDKDKKLSLDKAEELINMLGIEGGVEINFGDETVDIVLDTPDSGVVIGRHGDILESLQLVLSIAISKKLNKFLRISLEVGDYKKNREEWLKNTALNAKDKAINQGREITLPELKAWERRIVHLTLKDDEEVISESIGEGRDRVLIIRPK